MKHPIKALFPLSILLFIIGCHSSNLPTKRYSQFTYEKSYAIENGQLRVTINNTLYAPLRIWLRTRDEAAQAVLNELNPVLVQGRQDTTFYLSDIDSLSSELFFPSLLGDLNKEIKNIPVALPFPKGKTYRIIQGNDTDHTHSTEWSRYAVDFAHKINDTISAATDGYVVGLVDQYRYGGPGDKWRPFGNFLTIYDPESGLYTQYVHLVHKGSFVKVGDRVIKGQPIALSGYTGQTDIEHLHFNVMVPVHSNDGLKSVPHVYEEGYKSKELKRNDYVKH